MCIRDSTKVQTRTWNYVDACGNESDEFVQTKSWTVDVTKPTLSGQSTIDLNKCNPTAAEITAAFIAPTIAEACGTPTIKSGYPSTSPVSTVNCSSTQARTWVYVDACGNESDPFVQTVKWTTDVAPPTWTTSAGSLDKNVDCNNSAALAAAQLLAPTAGDNCPGTISYTKTSGVFVANACGGTYNNSWVATDACGNVSNAFTQVITVVV